MTEETQETEEISTPQYLVDEVHVQVILRELDDEGETIAKHSTEPLRFVSERAFREWAAQPFNINQRL